MTKVYFYGEPGDVVYKDFTKLKFGKQPKAKKSNTHLGATQFLTFVRKQSVESVTHNVNKSKKHEDS